MGNLERGHPERVASASELDTVGMSRLVLGDQQQSGEVVDEACQRAERPGQAVACERDRGSGELLQPTGSRQPLRVGRVTEVEVVYAKLLVKGVIGVGTSCEDAEQDLVAMSGEVATDGDGCRIERLESRCEQQVWCRQCTRCENHNR